MKFTEIVERLQEENPENIILVKNGIFFIGEIIYVSKFKFIYGKNLIHKSVISMKLRLSDGEIAYLRGFDEIADEILRNDFKFVYIQGHLKTEGYTKIDKIYII